MDDKKQSYKLSWTQPYTEWIALQEAITEARLENSNLEEAEQVINYIKGLKK